MITSSDNLRLKQGASGRQAHSHNVGEQAVYSAHYSPIKCHNEAIFLLGERVDKRFEGCR
ncbi:hypothetical protein FHR27_003045 [Pseudomonas flavescens]|uniref:Uncharacterized protein n=1 Tax=Phytopseudomonas flavescens TaxID=29435 RepID=A0A7Z0BPX1_9GAMM|nr:hypothetical protein [Pseudomonas flavescens]